MAAKILMAASAAIILALGVIHLAYTFFGSRLLPRDPLVLAAMNRAQLVLTDETTVARAWIGFNASHSMALILFGLVFGYLALAQAEVLFGSAFLLAVGFALLAGLLALAKLYWFSIPVAGAAVALSCYVASVVARWG